MSQVLKQLEAMKSPYMLGQPGCQEAIQYIKTGDPQLLAAAKPVRNDYLVWAQTIGEALSPPDRLDEEDRRALAFMLASACYPELRTWLVNALSKEKANEDLHAAFRAELASAGAADADVTALTAGAYRLQRDDGSPNSAGRFLLSLSPKDLKSSLARGRSMSRSYETIDHGGLVNLLLAQAPDQLPPLIDGILSSSRMPLLVCKTLLERDPGRYEESVVSNYRAMKQDLDQLRIGHLVLAAFPGKYDAEVLANCRAMMEKPSTRGQELGIWMVEHFGAEVVDDVVTLLDESNSRRKDAYRYWGDIRLLSSAVKAVRAKALPIVLAALKHEASETRLAAVQHLIEIDDGTHDTAIRSELERGLKETSTEKQLGYLKLVARWKPETFEETLWGFLASKSKPVRTTAARALAQRGDAVLPRAVKLMEDKKADVRGAVVLVLSQLSTAEALAALGARLDLEGNDDVRDAMLTTLDAARTASGKPITKEEVEARITRAAAKLKAPVVDWLDESRLPPIRLRDGEPLTAEQVRYLLYRQSRAKEIQADVEARPLYALIDRGSSGDFALEVLKRFAATKAAPEDRWAMATAALLGDDRCVPVLNSLVHHWAESNRGKMAEYAVQALALLGSDVSLTTLDALAIRYRSKNKNIGQAAVEAFAAAAERLGITPDELGDRVVPWLGFSPNQSRLIDCGGRKIEASIGANFKLKFRDVEKNKAVASLPKTAAKEVLDEFKGLGATLREVVKAQTLRLENLMVRQYRWPSARWVELFLAHPLLKPFGQRLIWGASDSAGECLGTFRTLDDGSLTDASDDPFVLPENSFVGMIHPLELDEATLKAWRTHLADYEVVPPFPQLERPVVRVGDDQRTIKIWTELAGTSVNGLTFKGRADKLGWSRGSVTDGGGIDSYRKSFAAAGVDAFLDLEGFYIGIDMTSEIKLGNVYFVKANSVKVGSYTYDNPSGQDDARLIPFGAVPPVVFSEILGDLGKISGKKAESMEAEE